MAAAAAAARLPSPPPACPRGKRGFRVGDPPPTLPPPHTAPGRRPPRSRGGPPGALGASRDGRRRVGGPARRSPRLGQVPPPPGSGAVARAAGARPLVPPPALDGVSPSGRLRVAASPLTRARSGGGKGGRTPPVGRAGGRRVAGGVESAGLFWPAPSPSRAGSAEVPRLPGARRRGGGRGTRPPGARPARARASLLLLQVPSASRRGGLKTPRGGSPVRLGSGADGPAGSRAGLAPPFSPPGPRCPPLLGARGARTARRGEDAAAPGAGFPARRPASAPWRACAALRVPGEAGNPLGACGVPGLAPGGRRPDAPSSTLPRPPSESGLVVCRRPAGGSLFPPPPSGVGGEGVCRCRTTSPPQTGEGKLKQLIRLLAVDHSARASMKNAASCEN